ncbi:MAG: phosphogluconate dehydrogenase (NAD(+)-dependent, decarboxylating) [Candidatus Saccharibacteria bacterium]
MKLGFIGLGKMGQQMVKRLLDGDHEVVVSDLNQSFIDLAVSAGAEAAANRSDLVAKLGGNAIIWLMIPAQFVQAEVEALLEILPAGSIIIDGGNSNYLETIKRATLAKAKGIDFVDVGTSGGVLGLEHGFSMMIGGEAAAFARIEPLIKSLAQEQGYGHFGPAGAGHFVKMVHNGIEYGMMEAYAEGYHILQEGHDFGQMDLAKIGQVWEHGSIIASNLNALTAKVLTANPTLNGIEGIVAQSGEAKWTLEAAAAKGIKAPVIQTSLDVRTASENGDITFATKLLAAQRNAFGGHDINAK